MTERDATCVGRVRHVLGSTVTVALDPDMAGTAPLWEGRMQPVGQVGSVVRLPQGPTTLLGTVSLVGIAELSAPLAPAYVPQTGDRWLQVQLVGEIDGLGKFHRGVSTYPALDDPVHFATTNDLRSVYPAPDADHVRLGRVASAPAIPAALDAATLVVRHSSIVGSTGSGKSTAVAALLRNFLSGGWTNGSILVIDPHGEYMAAFKAEEASVHSVVGDGEALLRVPYWALPAADILTAFAGVSDYSVTVTNKFTELVTLGRQKFADDATWIGMDPRDVGADTPIPFDARKVWFRLHTENTWTFTENQGSGDECIRSAGDPSTLEPPVYEPPAMGARAPFKGPGFGLYGTVPDRLRAGLLDQRLRFFRLPEPNTTGSDPLPEVMGTWLGGSKSVSILDFSGVPAGATDLAVGVVLQLLFELAVHSAQGGIGREAPVLVVLEEAHRYLGDLKTTRIARESVNRIAREGRKYGIGLMLVTQRPSELPATALAQVGTILSLRLTNASDQATVKAALPDSTAGLADALPSLRTGEAIVSGEAMAFPTRVLIDLPSLIPDAQDPSLDSWRGTVAPVDLTAAVKKWRGEDSTDA